MDLGESDADPLRIYVCLTGGAGREGAALQARTEDNQSRYSMLGLFVLHEVQPCVSVCGGCGVLLFSCRRFGAGWVTSAYV